jgi:outer membrane protein OmpA-like peptidoglycan-associated protein
MFRRFSFISCTLAALVPLVMSARPAMAQRDGSWEFSAGAGAMNLDRAFGGYLGSSGFANVGIPARVIPAMALRTGYNINRTFGFSAGVGVANGSGMTFVTPFVAATATANINHRTSPFLTAGTQFTRVSGENSYKTHPTWGIHLGAGVRHMITPNVALRFEGRMQLGHFASLPGGKSAYNSVATLGLSYFTPGRRARRAQVVAASPVYTRPMPPRVDTVRVMRVDTVRAVRVDTVTVKSATVISADQVVLRVQFRTDRAELLPISRPILNTVASAIRATPNSHWQVEGHTDSVGGAAHNRELSLARAQTVVDYLVSQGVDRSLLSAVGYGSERQVFSNTTLEGRAQNRRVQLRRIPPAPTGVPVP